MIRANQPLWVPDGPFEQSAHAYVKSEFFAGPLAVDVLARLVDQLVAGRVYAEYRDVEFTPWRGAYARETDSAFVHREADYLISHTVLRGSAASANSCAPPANGSTNPGRCYTRTATGMSTKATQTPSCPTGQQPYYGDQVERLRQVKTRYDTDRMFGFAQSIERLAPTASPCDPPIRLW